MDHRGRTVHRHGLLRPQATVMVLVVGEVLMAVMAVPILVVAGVAVQLAHLRGLVVVV